MNRTSSFVQLVYYYCIPDLVPVYISNIKLHILLIATEQICSAVTVLIFIQEVP